MSPSKKHIILQLSLILLFVFFNISEMNSQTILRSAIGSAGLNIHTESIRLQSIIGQSSLTVNRNGFIQPNENKMQSDDSDVIDVYPNPTVDDSIIRGVPEGVLISIYDMTGKLIERFRSDVGAEQLIDLKDHPDGIYLIKITGKNTFKSLRLIKMN